MTRIGLYAMKHNQATNFQESKQKKSQRNDILMQNKFVGN